MKTLLYPVFALLILAMSLPVVAQEEEAAVEIDLRPHFEEGRATRYEQWGQHVSVTTLTAQGQSQAVVTTIDSTSEVTWTVQSVEEDGTAVCTLETHSVEVTYALTIDDQELMAFTISSSNPTGDMPPYDDMVRAMCGNPLTYRVKADGTVESVSGGDAIRNLMGDNADIFPDDDELLEMGEGNTTLPGIPETLLAGGTWTDTDQSDIKIPLVPIPFSPEPLEVPAEMTETVTYTLGEVGEIEGMRIATVSVSSESEIEEDTSELPEGMPPVNTRLDSASSEGEFIFDLTRREIAAAHISNEYTVVGSLTGPDGSTLTTETTVTDTNQTLRVEEN